MWRKTCRLPVTNIIIFRTLNYDTYEQIWQQYEIMSKKTGNIFQNSQLIKIYLVHKLRPLKVSIKYSRRNNFLDVQWAPA